jgi:hemolysin activation/secretion protein
LGDDSGVRGYPLNYQHGERTTQFTLEARYYPHINIYKLFELGGAAFIDAGKAFGNSPVANVNTSVLASVGIGARFYSTHSSDAQVIHLDLVKPLSTDTNVNGIEFRITTKHSF